MSGRALELLTDVFLFYDFSVTGLIQSVKVSRYLHVQSTLHDAVISSSSSIGSNVTLRRFRFLCWLRYIMTQCTVIDVDEGHNRYTQRCPATRSGSLVLYLTFGTVFSRYEPSSVYQIARFKQTIYIVDECDIIVYGVYLTHI